MSSHEHYEFEVPEEGLDYNILDLSFNPTTQAALKQCEIPKNGVVLDVGSGSGMMTAWMAKNLVPEGRVISIDIDESQQGAAKRTIEHNHITNVDFKIISAYELHELNESFDLVYCRFVLHHLHEPRKAIGNFYQQLKPGGFYFGEEGIVSSAFAYPPNIGWHHERTAVKPPEQEQDGLDRDGDFGMKLIYNALQTGFTIQHSALHQPILHRKEDKARLMVGHLAFKQTLIEQGVTEADWQSRTEALDALIQDDNAIVGFYQSMQMIAQKP